MSKRKRDDGSTDSSQPDDTEPAADTGRGIDTTGRAADTTEQSAGQAVDSNASPSSTPAVNHAAPDQPPSPVPLNPDYKPGDPHHHPGSKLHEDAHPRHVPTDRRVPPENVTSAEGTPSTADNSTVDGVERKTDEELRAEAEKNAPTAASIGLPEPHLIPGLNPLPEEDPTPSIVPIPPPGPRRVA